MLLFFDIDGTLTIPGHPPSPATVAAIRAARAKGHLVFLSTGRLECTVAGNIHAIGFDGGIYSAGARAVLHGTELLNRPMPPELVCQVTGLLREKGMFFFLECAGGLTLGADETVFSPQLRQVLDLFRSELDALGQARMSEHESVYKVVFLAEDKEQGYQLMERLRPSARTVSFLNLLPNQRVFYGEISPWGIDKGAALNHICQHLGVSPADCVAFGDSMNDAEILQAAGIGVAMGNADDQVKELADQVCESCQEDGVAKTLARMKLI